MHTEKYMSGVIKIINYNKNQSYYHACENLEKCISEQIRLLNEGKHGNKRLQEDYLLQKGRDFSLLTMEDEVDFKTAKEIESIWVESDASCYNNFE